MIKWNQILQTLDQIDEVIQIINSWVRQAFNEDTNNVGELVYKQQLGDGFMDKNKEE